MHDGDQLAGHGRRAIIRRPDITQIGAEITVAPALAKVSHNLLNTAAAELAAVTRQPVRWDSDPGAMSPGGCPVAALSPAMRMPFWRAAQMQRRIQTCDAME